MKLQTIIYALLAAAFTGAVTLQFRKRIGIKTARILSVFVAVTVFGLSLWLRS